MSRKVPLAIFTYNRPMHTRRLLESVERNADRDGIDVWIFCDAPKKPEHAPAVEETREAVRRWASGTGATVRERASNLGIARSIVGATSDLTEEYGRIIVLEDDLVIAPDFLRFMLEGLHRYETSPRVMQISGHLHIPVAPTSASGFFLPLCTSWGWATWARAWRHFKWGTEIDARELETDAEFERRFTVEGSYTAYLGLLRHCLNEPGEVWDIFWWYAMAKVDGLVVHPRKSLVWNGGFDGSGVHCGSATQSGSFAPPREYLTARLPPELDWPSSVGIDPRCFRAMKAELSLMNGTGNLFARGRRKARRVVGSVARWRGAH